MSKLHDALGLDDLLAAATSSLAGWALVHPDLGPLLTLDDVVLASQTGSLQDRDDVLFRLAQHASVASVDGADSREAAAVLCHLLVPGVIAKLGRMRLPVSSDVVNELAAGHLWVQCRTFPCGRRPKVAPTIVWNVRRAVLADLGVTDRRRGDKTWANTEVVEQDRLDYLIAPVSGDSESSGQEFAELLEHSLSDRLITREQALLLLTLLHVSERAATKRATRHGLLSDEVSRLVGDELGMGASTVRYKVSFVLSTLRQVNQKAA